MKVKGTFLIDTHTLFCNLDLIPNFQNCLLKIPHTHYLIFKKMYEEAIQRPDLTEEERAHIKEYYEEFIQVIDSNKEAIGDMLKEKKHISQAICLDTIDLLFVCFTNRNIPQVIDLPQEAEKKLDMFEIELLNTSKFLNTPIFTTSKKIYEIISQYNLPIACTYVPEQ